MESNHASRKSSKLLSSITKDRNNCSKKDGSPFACTISGGNHKKSRKNKNPNENYTPKNKSRKISNKNYL
jgi:hypothetical protein